MAYQGLGNNSINSMEQSITNQSPLSGVILMIWLSGMIIMSPVKIFTFPLNMELMDFWILALLPILWMLFIARRKTLISWTYVPIMLMILIGSFASTFAAPKPSSSIIVILKEVYVFVWFITITILLSGLGDRNLNRLLIVWNRVVVVHGLVIIAQFLSPTLWRITVSLARNVGEFEHYRSPGLFPNANAAAFFQLMGFVPLVLAKESKWLTIIMGIIVFMSLLATGSMGAFLGLAIGTLLALTAIVILAKNLGAITKYFGPVLFAILLFGSLLFVFVSQNREYQNHLESILVGRADRSSEGRFSLWERGMDAFIEYSGVFWGIGPENFREVDGRDKQLHNDFIAFSVERGLLTGITLILFLALAIGRSFYLFRASMKSGGEMEVVVFVSAFVAIFIESLFHQVFHYRELWLVLAFQEAMIFKTKYGASLRDIS